MQREADEGRDWVLRFFREIFAALFLRESNVRAAEND
jgi:hypothetical protein